MAAGKLDHQPALARALVVEPQQVVFSECAQGGLLSFGGAACHGGGVCG